MLQVRLETAEGELVGYTSMPAMRRRAILWGTRIFFADADFSYTYREEPCWVVPQDAPPKLRPGTRLCILLAALGSALAS